jgi:uncharacterized BrkB/YihY/UPF0761 family membrane protein
MATSVFGRVARLRSSLTSAVATATETADGARRRWRAVDAAFATVERDRRAVGNVLAGAVAFRLFVYLLPLVLVVFSVLGVVARFDESTAGQLGDDLGMSKYLVDSVDTAAEESQRALWVLVPVALWATYWAGVGTVKVLRAIHALAWGQPVQRLRRGWVAAVGSFGFALALAAVALGTQVIRERSELAGLGFMVLQVVLLVGLWLVVSRALPHDPKAGWLALLPGACLLGVGAWALHLASVYVLARRVDKASDLYGSLGVAAALLVWLYMLGRLVVAAAMVNATLWERRTHRVSSPGPESRSAPPPGTLPSSPGH